MSQLKFELLENGERSICIQLKQAEQVQQSIHVLANVLKTKLPTLIDIIPATESITVVTDEQTTIEQLREQLNNILSEPIPATYREPDVHVIEVCYDPRLAPDLTDLLDHLQVDREELIKLHTDTEHQLDMLGFLPGFLYLSGLPEQLHIPRKDTPSLVVPAGSVAIAGNQTGIYSISSPGGWWVIGRTANSLFNSKQHPPIKLHPMDKIHFRQIDYEEWQASHEH